MRHQHRRHRTVALALGLGLAAAGLVGTAPAQAAGTAPAPRVVVGDVDGSFNPYHPFFYDGPRSVTPDVLAEFGIDAEHQVTLTRTGDFAADYAADKAGIWDRIEAGKPVWFVGTNVIGVAFTDVTDGDPTTIPILEESASSHGTGTVSAVLTANPEAVVLLAEGTAEAAAENFVFGHPAVDIVTTSYGLPGSLPVVPELNGSFQGVTQGGKLHFGAADNSPALSPQDGTSGPWWSIGIGGFHEGTSEGRELLSGNLVDFLGDFTQDLPYCGRCENGASAVQNVSGTSFATPRSAGTASKILLEARRVFGHTGGTVAGSLTGPQPVVAAGAGRSVTTWQFRRALEEAAAYPGIDSFDAASAVTDDLTAAPILPGAPYLQSGWGILSPDAKYGVVTETLARLGVAGTAPTTDKRTETPGACEYNQDVVMTNRIAYWNTNVQSEAFGADTAIPYLSCGEPTMSASTVGPPPVVPEVPFVPLLALGGAALMALAVRRSTA